MKIHERYEQMVKVLELWKKKKNTRFYGYLEGLGIVNMKVIAVPKSQNPKMS
jgi:hypothetical protein